MAFCSVAVWSSCCIHRQNGVVSPLLPRTWNIKFSFKQKMGGHLRTIYTGPSGRVMLLLLPVTAWKVHPSFECRRALMKLLCQMPPPRMHICCCLANFKCWLFWWWWTKHLFFIVSKVHNAHQISLSTIKTFHLGSLSLSSLMQFTIAAVFIYKTCCNI